MSYNLSGCVFIKDAIDGAFCIFESMYQLLPLCDEFVVMDLGSTDGTLEALNEIARHNPKVRIIHSTFYENDAAVFAKLANDVISECAYDTVLYYQSDEIWHENLIKLTRAALADGHNDLAFWRVQLRYNFQTIKWFPHPVHRIAPRSEFNFVNDGMNTERVFSSKMVSQYGFSKFMQWSDLYKFKPVELPLHEMILDVSLTGGFIDNIPARRRMHLPFWNEPDVMPADEQGLGVDDWYNQQKSEPRWSKTDTRFNIPEIMKFHLGRKKYVLRPQLLEALKASDGWR
jgi:glycosyltransferase involved in cell wall biosynthesis